MVSAPNNRSSAELAREARTLIPAGVNSTRRAVSPDRVWRRAAGAHFWDVDGNKFLDFHGGAGAVVLGHADLAVQESANRWSSDGECFGSGITLPELNLARALVSHFDSIDQVVTTTSGTLATSGAIRIARAATNRRKIIKFEGHYHGNHDSVLTGISGDPALFYRPSPASAGLTEEAVRDTILCRWNDLDDLAEIGFEYGDRIAAIIAEPVAHNGGPTILPNPGFLEGLRHFADDYGAVLIFDEVITGLRHAVGGYQSICGVRPDLTSGGKCLGNGKSIAFLGGRRWLMEQLERDRDHPVTWYGTTNGHPGSSAAGVATIEQLIAREVPAYTAKLGDRCRTGLREIFDEADVMATVTGYGGIFTEWFREGPIETPEDVVGNDFRLWTAYRLALQKRGVWVKPDRDGARCHISAAHTEADIDTLLEASRDSIREARDTLARSR
jgi:glutamate-1-semialdehyde 2,1-aminomutase